ncbi:hypothetical protein [Carboxylicivirga caseinilyticus]|uniref:hypothetical protein n=1 Tax=Carboxylicivirga caseinilyticus TaxID=3417572 RepID=UPI003D32D146|nr:hypothetical protein [Marinilabiliaceae bacterium A049]
MKHIIIILFASFVSHVAIGQNANEPTFEETVEFLQKLLNNAQTHRVGEKFRYEVTDTQIVIYVYNRLDDEDELKTRDYINLNEIDSVAAPDERSLMVIYGIYPTSITEESIYNDWNKTSESLSILYTKNMDEIDRIFKALQHLAKLSKQKNKPLF